MRVVKGWNEIGGIRNSDGVMVRYSWVLCVEFMLGKELVENELSYQG